MCKTTNEPVGIPIPLPSVLPPIERWYVVARKITTGTCSIYSSWENYQAETKPSPTISPSSPARTEKKKRAIEDAKATELAAFPTMAQAIAYVKNFESSRSSTRSSTPVASTVISSPATNTRIHPSKLSPDDSQSTVPQDTAAVDGAEDIILTGATATSRNSPSVHPRKRIYRSALKTIEVVDDDQDCTNDNTTDDKATSNAKAASPSPVPSESPIKKRKVDIESNQASLPIFRTNRLSMSKTSETIDIGAPARRKPDTSNFNALAMLASASSSKKTGKDKQAQSSRDHTKSTKESTNDAAEVVVTEPKPPMPEGARLSPAELIAAGATHVTVPRETISSRMAQLSGDKTGRLPGALSPTVVGSNIAARNSVNEKQLQELLLQRQRKVQELKRLEEQTRSKSLAIPKVPTPFSELKIPEVPKGFVPEERKPDGISRAISDLKSSIDRKIMMNSSPLPSMMLPSASASARAMSNRLMLDSYPLGQFPSQLQRLPQQLLALQQEASMYRNSSDLLSLQLQQSSRNLLNRHLLSSSIYAQQHLQQHQTIDLASSGSDCDHSEITLKRRNGPSSATSSPRIQGKSAKSPINLGAASPNRKTKRGRGA